MRHLTLATLLAVASAQQPAHIVPEEHPALSWQKCTSAGCDTVQGEVVLDSNWRWLPKVNGYEGCYEGNEWDYNICDSGEACAAGCSLEGAAYEDAHFIKADNGSLTLKYKTQQTYNSRVFLMESETRYQTFTLLGNEFAFDVDLSKVGCGINSALYFVAMDPDGGLEEYPGNKAGAKYGTGYCDASCSRSQRFVAGAANVEGWEPSVTDPDNGIGNRGACCPEFDIWNSNANSYSMSSKPCFNDGYTECETEDCDPEMARNPPRVSQCDKWGCDYNPYRLGVTDFYGQGKTVDTTKPFTVVTQFSEDFVTQFFIQDGVKIETPAPAYPNFPDVSGLNAEYCEVRPVEFEDIDRFGGVGGFNRHVEMLSQPMVLTMAIQDDHWSWNVWLDSVYPLDREGLPGARRGVCDLYSNEPDKIKLWTPEDTVVWSNIRFGPIGSTVDV